MQKKLLSSLLLLGTVAFSWSATPTTSEATPAFARQVGMSCLTCHFQHIPKLNSFGRAFKLGAFTDVGMEELIEDEHLSIPAVLNLAFITRVSYSKTSSKTALAAGTIAGGENRGNIDFPRNSALFIAGRMGEHWGAVIEFPGPLASGKFNFSYDFGSYKAGFSLYTTEGMGPFAAVEVFNTGLSMMHISTESNNTMDGSATTASMRGLGMLAATGLTLYASNDNFVAQLGLWAPATGAGISGGTALSSMYRLALTHNVAGFDSMIGIYGTAGTTKTAAVGDTATTDMKTQAFGVDAQAQGEIGGMPLGLYANYVGSIGRYSATNYYATYMRNGVMTAIDNYTAYSIFGELEVMQNVGLKLGYLHQEGNVGSSGMMRSVAAGTEKSSSGAFTIGAWWNIEQNVVLTPEYTAYSGRNTTNAGNDNVLKPAKNRFQLTLTTAF